MRIINLILIFFAFTALVSCGGGGTTAAKGGKNSIQIKLNLPGGSKARSKTDARFTIGNTNISSVYIDYGLTGGESTSIDATSAAENQTEVTINNLEANKQYSFSVRAYSSASTMVCQGGDTLTIQPNTTSDLNLTCTFEDRYAVENFLFNIEAKLLDNTMTSALLSDYVAPAADFGTFNGMDRAAFISNYINQRIGLLDDGLTLVTVQLLDPRSVQGKSGRTTESVSQIVVKYIYDDGSYEFQELWAAKIDNEWYLVGNGEEFDLSITNSSNQLYIATYQADPIIYNGIYVDAGTYATTGIENFELSGNGYSAPVGYNFQQIYGLTLPILDAPNYVYAPEDLYFENITNNLAIYTDGSTIHDGDKYDFSIYKLNNEETTASAYIKGDGITYTGADTYPTITAELLTGNEFNFNVTQPTKFTPSKMKIEIVAINHITQQMFKSFGRVPLNGTSFSADLVAMAESEPDYGYVRIIAYDSDGRAFSTFYSFDRLNMHLESGGNPDPDPDPDPGVTIYGYFIQLLHQIGLNLGLEFYGASASSDNTVTLFGRANNVNNPDDTNSFYDPIILEIDPYGDLSSSHIVTHNGDPAFTNRSKLLTGADGTKYLVAGTYSGTYIICVAPDYSAIEWARGFMNNDSSEEEQFIDATLVPDENSDGKEEIDVLMRSRSTTDNYDVKGYIFKVLSGGTYSARGTFLTKAKYDGFSWVAEKGGHMPIKIITLSDGRPAVLTYSYLQLVTTNDIEYTTLNFIVYDTSLTNFETIEVYDGMSDLSALISDGIIITSADMAAGRDGHVYVTFSDTVSAEHTVYIAQILTAGTLSKTVAKYNVTGMEIYSSKIAVTTNPAETEDLVYVMTEVSPDGSTMWTVMNQFTQSAFIPGWMSTGLVWSKKIPTLEAYYTSIAPGAASSVVIASMGYAANMKVDGTLPGGIYTDASTAFTDVSLSELTQTPRTDTYSLSFSMGDMTYFEEIPDIFPTDFNLAPLSDVSKDPSLLSS